MPRSKQLSEEMRARSRAQILQSARRLFADYGYFKCKISDIAREAGMSQGNIYWYFPSKEEILKAVLSDGFETLGEIMKKASEQSGTSHEKLDFLLDGYLTFGRDRGHFIKILMSLLSHGGQPFMGRLGFEMESIGLGYHQSLNAILKQGQAEGMIRADVDPNVLTMFFFAFFNGLLVTYAEDWLEMPEAKIRSAIFRLVGSEIAEGTTS